jgi:hypothetical protein
MTTTVAFAALDSANSIFDAATSSKQSDMWNSMDSICNQAKVLQHNIDNLNKVNELIQKGQLNADEASKLIGETNVAFAQQQSELTEKQKEFKTKIWTIHIRNISIVGSLGILIFLKLYYKK